VPDEVSGQQRIGTHSSLNLNAGAGQDLGLGNVVRLHFSVLPEATFAQRLRKARIQKGFGQTELALAAGLSENLVWRWETGLHGPSPRKLRDVARVLGVVTADSVAQGL